MRAWGRMLDATSCDSSPQPNVAPAWRSRRSSSAAWLRRTPRLAGAAWGARMEDSSSREVLRYRLAAGEHTGTMGEDGKHYTFRTRVQPLSRDAFSLSILVEEDGTGRTEELTGALLDRGQSGTLKRVGRGGPDARLLLEHPRTGEVATSPSSMVAAGYAARRLCHSSSRRLHRDQGDRGRGPPESEPAHEARRPPQHCPPRPRSLSRRQRPGRALPPPVCAEVREPLRRCLELDRPPCPAGSETGPDSEDGESRL